MPQRKSSRTRELNVPENGLEIGIYETVAVRTHCAIVRLAPSFTSAAGLRKNPSGMPNRCARPDGSQRTLQLHRNLERWPFASARRPSATAAAALHFAFRLASRASRSALRRLWFCSNSSSAWLSDIFCLVVRGWSARRSVARRSASFGFCHQAICFCGYVRRRIIFRRSARLRTESGARFICIPMSRASIRFNANERRRSSSVLLHGLVVKSSCPVIWTSPSARVLESGKATRFDRLHRDLSV
jgi:hypothetical protein